MRLSKLSSQPNFLKKLIKKMKNQKIQQKIKFLKTVFPKKCYKKFRKLILPR